MAYYGFGSCFFHFRNVGFVSGQQEKDVVMESNDSDGDRVEFQSIWDRLKDLMGPQIPDNIDEYLDVDADEYEAILLIGIGSLYLRKASYFWLKHVPQ